MLQLGGELASLPLAHAFADVAELDEAMTLAADGDEYLALGGTVALGGFVGRPEVVVALRERAADARWRVWRSPPIRIRGCRSSPSSA